MEDRRLLEREDFELRASLDLIRDELERGFRAVNEIDRPGVTIFGSARLHHHPFTTLAEETGRLFAEAGFAVITGGGPGVMEAANRGAKLAGGLSVGFNIDLPHEQEENPYLDIAVRFDHFYARKVMLVKAAEGFVLFPGGFGTLDEMFESLTLIQTAKVWHFPVILMGTDYWDGLLDWIRERPLAEGMVSPEDIELLRATDSPDEAVQWIVDCYERHCAEIPAEPAKADAQ